MIRSENSSTHSENHNPEVNLDPDPSSSDSLDSSSSDSAPKIKKSKNKKKRRKHQKDDLSDPSSSDDSDLSDDSQYRRKRQRDKNVGKRIRSDYAQLKRHNFSQQRIRRRLLGSKWMRIHSSVGFEPGR